MARFTPNLATQFGTVKIPFGAVKILFGAVKIPSGTIVRDSHEKS